MEDDERFQELKEKEIIRLTTPLTYVKENGVNLLLFMTAKGILLKETMENIYWNLTLKYCPMMKF